MIFQGFRRKCKVKLFYEYGFEMKVYFLPNFLIFVAQQKIGMRKESRFRRLKIVLFMLCMGVIMPGLKAQYYSGGQNPASLKWKQINSPFFQIIFPEGFEHQANYVLNVLEYARNLDVKTLRNEPPKISVILNNRTVVSNANVGWAPKRMELFTQPPQDIYAQDWLQQLAIHEYRHVVQIDKMNQGLTQVLYALFGEQITAGVYGLYVPWWFIEGDAVVSETALSSSGRGRQPFFEMQLRTQILQKGFYSYDKAAHGSYKDFTPSHYHLGYYLVGFSRLKYGVDLWNKVLDNVAKKPWSITPFSSALKKATGLSKGKFYRAMLSDLDSIWHSEAMRIKKTDFFPITKSNSYINYLNPTALSPDFLVSLKEDYQGIGQIVSLDKEGNQKLIFKPGSYFPETLSAENGIICWLEYDYDPRWSYQTFTKIMTYSLEQKKKRKITSHQRYFSPSLNKTATKVVVAESTVNYEHGLAIIELRGGLKEKEFRTDANDFMSYPSWSKDEKKIVAVCLNEQGKSLVEFDVSTGEYRYLLPFASVDLRKPIYWKNYILYQAAYSGISNIYALNPSTKKIVQLTSSAYGAHSPQVWNDQLVYSEYTANGNQIALADLNPEQALSLAKVKNTNYPLADLLQQQEGRVFCSDSIPQNKYKVKKYSKLAHLINPHSWGPFSFSPDGYSFKPGFTLSSQNKLSTLILGLGYEYDMNNEQGNYFADAQYLGWYPAINLRAEYGYRERLVHDTENDSDFLLRYHETNFKSGVYLPLFYNSGLWSQRIQPQLSFEYKQLDVLNEGIRFQKSNYKIVDYSVSFSNSMKSAKQDLYPKWGQSISVLYQQTPFDSSGDLFAFNSLFYFPGLFKHQGLRFYWAYQKRLGDADMFTDRISFPRGYSTLSFDEAISFKLDYKFPLAYPDFHLSSLLYIKRIKMAVFYDEVNHLKGNKEYYRSVGSDLLFDIHLLRSFVPFEIGLRSAYLLENKKTYFGFLGSIKL